MNTDFRDVNRCYHAWHNKDCPAVKGGGMKWTLLDSWGDEMDSAGQLGE